MIQNIFDTLKTELLGDQPMLSAARCGSKLTDVLDPCLGLNWEESMVSENDTKGHFFLSNDNATIGAKISGTITPVIVRNRVKLKIIDFPKYSDIKVYLIGTNKQAMLTIDNTQGFDVTHDSFLDNQDSRNFQTYDFLKRSVKRFVSQPKK